MALLRQLGIEPSILALQVIAFLILFILLRRYLFRPVLAVMAQREKEIADGLDAGERARAELAGIEHERERVLADAHEDGRQRIRQAVQEGAQAREQILHEARDEAQQIRLQARQSIELERAEAMLQLRRDVVDLALLAARKAVLTTLDEPKQRQAVDDFITSLESR